MLTRRYFLRSSAIALAGIGTAPSWLLRAAAQGSNKPKILVVVFQRGAADGLNIVVPFSEKLYYAMRPTIAVPEPKGFAMSGEYVPTGQIDQAGRRGTVAG